MMNQGYALARAELIHTLTAYAGITTTDGAPAGNTLVCAGLIGMNDFITEKTILIMTGNAQMEDKAAIAFNPATGQITVTPAFSAQILRGTIFRVLNISTVELDVVNILARIGTNADPAGTATLFAWMAKIFAGMAGLSGPVTPGTYSLPSGLVEQDALLFAAAYRQLDIELDMDALAQNTTVREYVQTDGANYRQISAKVFPTNFDTGTKAVILSFVQKNSAYKVTLQSAVAEGVPRDIPYRYMVRSLG
jgi:hypothetical protein